MARILKVPAQDTVWGFLVLEEYDLFRVLKLKMSISIPKKYHAFWRMYGMGLPDNILKKYIIKMH
jgi:hypothetical protein